MKTIFALVLQLVLLLSIAVPIPAETLAKRLQEIVDDDTATSQTFVGVVVARADTGEALYERFANNLFTPASNGKLYTSAHALDHYGPDHRFVTQLEGHGRKEGNRLTGFVRLQPGGDPVLESMDLRSMTRRAREQWGITSVDNVLQVGHSKYIGRKKGPGWMWDDEPYTFNVTMDDIMVDFNVLKVRVEYNDGDPAARLVPPSDYPPIVTMRGRKDSVAVSREPFTDVIRVTIPLKENPPSGLDEDSIDFRPPGNEVIPFEAVEETLTMNNPSQWVREMMRQMFAKEGIGFQGAQIAIPRPEEQLEPIMHYSPPLIEILARFNKPSENAIGEMLFIDLAIEKTGKPSDYSDGARVLREWLENEVGLADNAFRLVDGSGLSRYNLITPSGTVTLLLHMWNHPNRVAYVQSLPIAGVDGTLSYRMKGTPAQGRVYAKTGTMSGVSCLSGYVHTNDGQWLAFSILTNGYVGSSAPARSLQDRLCIAMAEWSQP